VVAIDLAAWQKFARDGAPLFDEPVVIENLLADPEHVAGLVDDAVRTATGRLHHNLRIKGYRQGVLDYRLSNALVLTPCGEGTANEWLARVTDDHAACASFSDLTAWSLSLAEWVQPLLKILLMDGRHDFLSGSDIYTFVSDAGWTPFGIHKDAEPSLILHLGPALKEIWVWPKGAINPASLPQNPSHAQLSFDFDDLLPEADHYLLKPGDFISVPTDYFHVFRNLGPSKFLGFSLYPTEVGEVVMQAFWDAAGKDFNTDETIASAGVMAALIQKSMQDFPTAESLKESMCYELHRASLRRRTFGYASCPRECALPSAPPPRDAEFRWAYDGVIAAVTRRSGTDLLVRGRSIEFEGAPDLSGLMSLADSAAPLTMDQIADVLPGELSADSRHDLVGQLYRFGALVVSH
jgi:hypothetical protein